MKSIRVDAAVLLMLVAATGMPNTSRARSADAAASQAQLLFRQLDVNADNELSGREVGACRCGSYDTDHDGRIPKSEFYAGFMLAAFEHQGQSVAGEPAAPTSVIAIPRAYKIGDRVEWNLSDIWFKGTIYSARDGRYQIDRDGYGRAQEWTSPAEIRRLVSQAAGPEPASGLHDGATAQQPSRATVQRFRPGDRVEINVGGTWYAGSVASAQGGRYRVHRDDHLFGVTSSETWVGDDHLRPLAVKSAVARAAAGALPDSLPAGLYSCITFDSGNTAGKLRILGRNTSSGVTPDGLGPQHAFAYDPGNGAIVWPAGLKIFSWTVERAEYRPDPKGTPNINLHYRLRAGGNLNSMGCKRG